MATSSIPDQHQRSAIGPSVLRICLDFGLGVGLFAVGLFGLSLGHGSAFAGTGELANTFTADHAALMAGVDTSFAYAAHRHAAFLMLAIGFGSVTALNMAIARRLRLAAVAVRHY